MFYAGYESIDTDVAVFATEQQRDNWLGEWSAFKRIPLSAEDVFFILDGMPDHVQREADLRDDSIVWLLNPFNSCL